MCILYGVSGKVVDGDGSGSLASRTVSIRLTNLPPDNAIDKEKEYMHAYALSETNTCCMAKGGWVGCCVHISYNCWEEQQLWI